MIDTSTLHPVFRVSWDGEPSMSGRPHIMSIGTEFHSIADAENAIKRVANLSRKPNIRVERRWVTAWESV